MSTIEGVISETVTAWLDLRGMQAVPPLSSGATTGGHPMYAENETSRCIKAIMAEVDDGEPHPRLAVIHAALLASGLTPRAVGNHVRELGRAGILAQKAGAVSRTPFGAQWIAGWADRRSAAGERLPTRMEGNKK